MPWPRILVIYSLMGAAGPIDPQKLAILYVDDEVNNLDLFRLQFEDEFVILTASSGAQALEVMSREDIAVILTDERMPGMSGIELLARVIAQWPDSVRIIVSAYSDAQRLLLAINRSHAHEYIVKPWNADDLRSCMQRALATAARRRTLRARAELSDMLAQDERALAHPSGALVTPGLKDVMARALRAAKSDATVLIQGETGSGKEIVARAIHEESARAGGPFVSVNCGALPESLLESELFGHEQGAFTGASCMRRGRFELAHGGTIFLDEIGDVSAKLQVTLLHVLQHMKIERVGGSKLIPLNVRVLAATHRDLATMMSKETFREDLFYRLNVLPIYVPPLRERSEDIAPLIKHFITKYATCDPPPRLGFDVLPVLEAYTWPGNVREVENLVQRALALCTGDEITLEDFCLSFPAAVPASPREEGRQKEAEELRILLVQHGGNFARVARSTGIARTTLISRAKRYGFA